MSTKVEIFLRSLPVERRTWIAPMIERGVYASLPGHLCSKAPNAIHYHLDRHGFSTVVVDSQSLTEDELSQLLYYRMANYLVSGMSDPNCAWDNRVEHEARSDIARDNIQGVSVTAMTDDALAAVEGQGAEVIHDPREY